MTNPGNMTYDEYDHPRMGVWRKSSARNEIIIKPKLGAAKRSTRDLPNPNFIYGILNEYTPTVADLMIFREKVPDASAAKGQDLRAMNKRAPRLHVTRANEQREYRREHPRHLRVKERLASVAPLPSVKNPKHIYGLPLPRTDNMDEVIHYAYANDFIRLNRQHQHDFQEIDPVFVPVKTNRTTSMRISNCCRRRYPASPKQRFILTKFAKVGKRIDNVQTIPLLRDERAPVFATRKNRKKREQ